MNHNNRPRFQQLKQGLLCALALGGLIASNGAQAAPTEPGPIKLGLIESMSGSFANTGESVQRNLAWAIERVNARGGVKIGNSAHNLELKVYDNKGQADEALAMLKAAQDDKVGFILQGNSSAVAQALVDALNKHNERKPEQRQIFLNYSAVDPALTNEKCSFWHFRYDAHADMRMAALMQVLGADRDLKSVYLLGQDYSFGQAVLREGRRQLTQQRPDVRIVGEDLHPVGKVKDFSPYIAKIMASGAQAVLTGNWGNDLTLLIKAAKEAGYPGKFYTFYGNALGAPAAIGEAGVGKVIAVADWMPNIPGKANAAVYQSFRQRYPKPEQDYLYLRMQIMVENLVAAIERAQSTEAVAVAKSLEGSKTTAFGRTVSMRAQDHQLQQDLAVGVLDKKGSPGVPYDVEGSGFGFRIIKTLSAKQAEHPSSCVLTRP